MSTTYQMYKMIAKEHLQLLTHFKGVVRKTYIAHLKRKNPSHFDTNEGARVPLETIFLKINFKPMVFGSFGEMSFNIKEVIEIAVDHGEATWGGA